MKKIISIAIILMLIIFSITNVYASNTMTKEELEQAIEKINNSENMNGRCSLDQNNIIITMENKQNILEYELEGNPKFTSQIIYTKDMNKEQFEEKNGELINGVLGFIIVAVHKGIEIDNAVFYSILSTLNSFTELEKMNTNDSFDAMQVANDIFGDGIFKEGDLFDITIKKVSSTESEYIVESTYEVKADADFSIIGDYDLEDVIPYNEILENTQIAQNEFFESATNEEMALNEMYQWLENSELQNSVLQNSGITQIPQTGKTIENIDVLFAILIISVLVLVLYIVYNRKIDGNK